MSEIKLSPSQQDAVNKTGKNLLVMASAGSGKTFVLIQRLLKRIKDDRISIDQIIAMTFTDAASIEMRNRLSKALKEKIAECDDSEEKAYLNLQLAKLVDAKISTIHSFCLDITKQYYYLLGISKNTCNNLIDEATAKQAKHLFLQEIFAQKYNTDKDLFLDLAKQTGCRVFNFDELEKLIGDVLNHANEKPDPVKWLKSLKYDHEINELEDVNPHTLKGLVDAIKLDLAVFIELYAKIIDLPAYCENEDLKIKLQELINLLEIDDYALLINALNNNLQLPKKVRGDDNPEFIEYSAQAETIGKNLAKKLIPIGVVIKLKQRIKPLNNLFLDIACELYTKFQDYKQSHEYIDFNDFEHYAYQILTMNDGAIAKTYRDQYKEILIDEFQDTNDIQYKMASLIAHDNLFLVGDVKQSIYRFRGARPDIMVALSKRDDFECLFLEDNYRSKKNIVTFNNEVFNELMNINGHNFVEKDAQKAEVPEQSQGMHEIIFGKVALPDDQKKNKDLIKTQGLAEWIIDLVQNEGLDFKDICVLVRKNSEMTLIKKVFDEKNIPCFCKDNEGYFLSYIIEVFTSYLKLLINPQDKISLVSILTSCLYGYTDDDLVNLSLNNFENIDDDKLKTDYLAMRDLLNRNDLIGLIDYFININNVYNDILDINERSNIDLLITKLSTYNITTGEELVTFIKESSASQKDKAYSISEEDNVVKIMTIHGSKGLQYKTIILYSKNSSASGNMQGDINFSDEYGLGFHITNEKYGDRYTSLAYIANQNRDNLEELNENLRVLYVALTRAVERLYFIDTDYDTDEHLSLAFFLKNKAFTPLIIAACKSLGGQSYLQEKRIELQGLSLPAPSKEAIHEMPIYKESLPVEVEEFTPSKLSHNSIELELEDNLGLDIGTRMHKVMELIDFNDVSIENIRKIDDHLTPQQETNILSAFKDPIYAEAISYDYYREYPFYYVKDHQNIHGIIDFYSVAKDKIILIDYKTDNLEVAQEFINRYHAQLEAYAKVLNESYNLPVEAYVYSFHLQKTIRVN